MPFDTFGIPVDAAPVSMIDAIGYCAAALVFLSFCMKTLIPLRLIAIASNIAFILYGATAGLTPILLLHSALLPLNILRTVEQVRTFRRVRATANGRVEVEALIPFMTVTTAKAGAVLFAANEQADKMYYIAEGTVHIPEIGKDLSSGTLFGEIGLFTADRIRTASARCATDCTLQVISYDALQRLCLRDAAFGLFLTKLIATRMAENQARAALSPALPDEPEDYGTRQRGMDAPSADLPV